MSPTPYRSFMFTELDELELSPNRRLQISIDTFTQDVTVCLHAYDYIPPKEICVALTYEFRRVALVNLQVMINELETKLRKLK